MGGAWKEFERERERGSAAVVMAMAVIALGVLLGLRLLGEREPAAVPESPPTAVAASVVEAPTVSSATVLDVPPEELAPDTSGGTPAAVGVYECWDRGQRVLSDHPCGADAQVRTVVVDRPDPADVARQQQRTWAAQRSSPAPYVAPAPSERSARTMEPVETSNASACAAVDAEIRWINARMRQGYTSQEGEYYRERWRDAQKRRAQLDCSG